LPEIECLHDETAERDRLLNAVSAIIAHSLADPDPGGCAGRVRTVTGDLVTRTRTSLW
jgi:hypothetical protein